MRLSSTEVYVVLVNLRGEVVASHQEPLGATTRQDVAKTIAQAVGTATARHGSAALIGVGVAVSGVVDHAGGMVRHSGSLGWEGVPLRAMLSEMLDVPVVIDSYVNCVAAGLLLFDTVLAGRDLLIFSVGPSLGASVVVQGRIHRGWNGAAGGFAHSRVGGARGAGDRPCHCGAVNCLETFSSHWGIVRELERRLEPTGDLADRDDEVIAEAAETLGTAMANAAKMLGPEHVVAAFTREMNLPVLARRAEAAFRRQYHHENTPAPDLEFTSADRPALAQGAAYVVLARMFTADLTGTGTHAR